MPTTLRNFRVSDIEYEQWQKAAVRLEMDVSNLVRAAVLFALSYETTFSAVATAGKVNTIKPDPKPAKKKS